MVLTNSAEKAVPVKRQQSENSSNKASLGLQVVAETDEPFVPVPDELIVNLKESREAVEALLDNLANTFAATTSVSTSNVLSVRVALLASFSLRTFPPPPPTPMARWYKLDVAFCARPCYGSQRIIKLMFWCAQTGQLFASIAMLAPLLLQCFHCVTCSAASSPRAFALPISSNRQQATTIPELRPMCMWAAKPDSIVSCWS